MAERNQNKLEVKATGIFFPAKSGVHGLSVKVSVDCTCPHCFWLLVAADMTSLITSLHTPSSLCVSTLTGPDS